MYLKSIKLAGFKSFVDPTTIPVRGNMNAIVGPNGCGKSNVVDAIRWVIGESSAKQLRGQSMSDVIFNGTTARNAVGKAMVELNFDNSANRVTGEYAGFTDIAIRREVERDGQSRYFLNGTSCRRKDILDIFLGTGLGPRSYSIIEQGMISRLIEAKPEDMRLHLEEVAGISKYKERRRETENRIRHTQENLDRLNDIREELVKQLRHLKRQANAAERYKVFKEEEGKLSSEIKVLQWQALQAKCEQNKQRVREESLKQEQQTAIQRECETELDKTKISQEQAAEDMQVVQTQFYTLGEEIARLEQQIKNHQDQIATWQQELSTVESAWEELGSNTSEYQQQIQEIEEEVSSLAPQSGEVNQSALKAKEAFTAADAAMRLWRQSWDKFQDHSSKIMSQADVARTKVEHVEKQLSKLNISKTETETAYQQINLSELESEITPLRATVAELSQTESSLKTDIETNKNSIVEARQLQKQHEQAHQSASRELQSLEREHAKLDGLQQAALGRTDTAITPWLKQNNLLGNRRLGQEIKVNPGWEQAVETVLSGYFDAVCVDNIESLADQIGEVSSGRVTLIDNSAQVSITDSNKFESLAQQIESSWPFAQWLQGIYISESKAEALSMRASLSADESIITKDGVWIGKNWIRVSKIKDPQSGIIARENKLNELNGEIEAKRNLIAEIEQQQQQAQQKVRELEQTRDQLASNLQSISAKQREAESSLNKKELQKDSLAEKQQRLGNELQRLQQQITDTESELRTTTETNNQLLEQKQALTDKREQLLNDRKQVEDDLEQKRQNAQQEQKFADELEIRISANESQLALLRQTLQRDQKQLQQLDTKKQDLENKLHADDSPLEQYQQTLQQHLTDRLAVEKDLNAAKNKLTELRDRHQALEDQKQQVLEAIDTIKTTIQQLQMDAQEEVVRSQTIKEQLEEAGLQLEAVIETLPEEAEIKAWEKRLSEVVQRISRLGAINLAAIDEHKEAEERQEYLDKQHADLTESLEVLQSAIAKIDKETKTRFRETFDKVNEGFKAIFPRVFGGGNAYLELTENNLLTTGIYVKAQPPGKRNASIHMLSGGEKALTAIALVFSMFALNPAPFCILDEVDAPLDDLNVGRFCQIVKEMASDTQFLIISHNKVTIETADHLMGVTMQEPGVSRLVAVDMDEALEMVEAA